MNTLRWHEKIAALGRTPPLLILQKALRQVPFRPVDVGKLCLLRFDGVPRVAPSLLRGAAIVRQGTLQDLDGLAQLRDLRTAFVARFAGGDRCVVAEAGGRIVGVEWFSDHPVHQDSAWGYRIEIPDGFVYAYDAFLDPAYRNTGIWLRFKAYLAELMVESRKRGVVTFVDFGNSPSLRTHLRFGFKPDTDVLVVKVLGRLLSIKVAGPVSTTRPTRLAADRIRSRVRIRST